MKKNICKILLIATAMAFGLAGCSAEAKVERQLELGASSMETGDYDKAIEAYEEVVSLDKYEIEGYKGLVIAMDADERGNEEIIQVVKDATTAISEIKESEEGLSEEDKAAAKDLYVVAVEAVDSNTDDQVTVLENAVEVIGEDGMLPDDFKGMLENALADNVLNGMDTTLAYVEMLENLLLGDEMPQVEEESEEASTEEVAEESQEVSEENSDSNIIELEHGFYTCLGPNADYPDTMSDYEFVIYDYPFRVTLPNDMCVDFDWVYKYGEMDISNTSDGEPSKEFTVSVHKSVLCEGENADEIIEEEYQVWVEAMSDDEQVNVVEHQRDDGAYVIGSSGGVIMMVYYEHTVVYDDNVAQDAVVSYIVGYHDINKTEMDNSMLYIMQSFKPITAENSVILDILNNENNASEQ